MATSPCDEAAMAGFHSLLDDAATSSSFEKSDASCRAA